MSALADAAIFAQDPDVLAPLTVALVDYALTVMNEDPQQVENHSPRASLATQTIFDPPSVAKRVVWAVATDEDTVTKWIGDDKDGAMDNFAAVVADVWNESAGITRWQ